MVIVTRPLRVLSLKKLEGNYSLPLMLDQSRLFRLLVARGAR
jgi:hypothetical protein